MGLTQGDTSISPSSPTDSLPAYENAPAYAAESYHYPLITYYLRATKPNISNLVSYESNASVYTIRYRSTTALPIFNRKGDIRISRKDALSLGEEVLVARADFRDNGTLPYCPHARFLLTSNGAGRSETVVEMEARVWKSWTFTYAGEPYIWTLRDVPACIELSSTSTTAATPVIARFTYGKVGTKVQVGGEAGHLTIWRDALTNSIEGREAVIIGCLTVLKYFDGLGRKFRNDGFGGGAAGALINSKEQERNKVRIKVMLF